MYNHEQMSWAKFALLADANTTSSAYPNVENKNLQILVIFNIALGGEGGGGGINAVFLKESSTFFKLHGKHMRFITLHNCPKELSRRL